MKRRSTAGGASGQHFYCVASPILRLHPLGEASYKEVCTRAKKEVGLEEVGLEEVVTHGESSAVRASKE